MSMGLGDHIEELQADEAHTLGAAHSGCVTKCRSGKRALRCNDHGAYRRNGYEAIRGDAGRRTYYERDQDELKARAIALGLHGGPIQEQALGAKAGVTTTVSDIFEHPQAWHFPPSGGKKNFRKANSPYPHNYHHILPWSSLSAALDLGEAQLVQCSGYNLNDGMNMIILPCFDRVALILGTFKHPNNHPDYSKAVAQAINEAKAEIAGADPNPAVHMTPAQAGKLREYFERWEKQEFFELMKKGKVEADARIASGKGAEATHVNEHQPSSMKTACDSLNNK